MFHVNLVSPCFSFSFIFLPPLDRSQELAFCIFFSVDLGIRVLVEQLRFVTGPMKWWNLLDVVLVSLMISSQITQHSGRNQRRAAV